MADSDASAQAPARNPQSPAAPAAPEVSSAPRAEALTIFKGCVSQWMGIKSYIVAAIVLLIGIAAVIFGSLEKHEHFERLGKYADVLGKIGFIGGLAMVLASVLMILYVRFSISANQYTITNRLIERESGMLVKKVDALDLSRVKHVDMKQTFFERMVNIGTIEIYSGDNQEPMLLIEDLPEPRPIYEKLRDAVIDISRRRGIIVE